MKRVLTLLLLLCVHRASVVEIRAAEPTGSGARPNPVASQKAPEPILRHHFAESAGFKSIGQVTTGLALAADELAASLARGGDGKVARFEGGRLMSRDAAVVLRGKAAFTLYTRFKAEGDAPDGTLLMQRGPGGKGSGAFELSTWPMPFLERQHLTFQGMTAATALDKAPVRFATVNLDLDEHPAAEGGWRDLVVMQTAGGPLTMLLDGKLISARTLPGQSAGKAGWPFEGAPAPLTFGATPDGALPFRGWLDEVALWDRALADAELAVLFGGTAPVDTRPARPAQKRDFANGISRGGAMPVAERYDWFDARLPAFRDRLEKTDPHFPRYHLVLPGQQWNRIAFYHGGKHHLFFGWTPGGCFRYFDDPLENIVWQHVVSEDLLHWTILPMPIRSPQWPNENGTFFVNDQGEVVTYYYGDRGDMPRMAVSRDADLMKWESFPDRVQFAGAPKEFKTRHDPAAVFKQGDLWYQVSTTVRPQAQAMALPLYTSRDLVNWDYAGKFFEDATGRSINECGQLFPLGGKQVFTSIHNLSKDETYMVGTIRADGTFAKEFGGVPDYSSLHYDDVSTTVDDAGVARMWRFTNVVRPQRTASAAGWQNSYTLPREVRLADSTDGKQRLTFRPSPEIERLRGPHTHRDLRAADLAQPVPLTDFKAASAEVRVQFKARAAGETGLRLTDGQHHTEAYYDHAAREIVLDFTGLAPALHAINTEADGSGSGQLLSYRAGTAARGPVKAAPGETITLRVFSDRSIFEIYANDEVVISNAAFFHAPENLAASIFTRAHAPGKITVDAWEMQPLKWSAKMNP